ncbi:u4 tri-snrnp-associated protein [Fusarium austroafricanum]|uniref:U4 tri-snrnp-associated protein n=1 Tax=Fusarium austroafricanum TaxID=2364996 RepID=A0A8H4NZS7_9HYPO|nr:u4 tri-snrnp-associated protein [Fusarium austroafricanum]
MGDSRKNRRPDSRQMWDESERRDRRGGRDRDNDRDRRSYRSRSRERRGYRDRSRSPDRRHRDRDGDRNRPRERGSRHHDDRDRRDRRKDGGEDMPPRQRRDERRDDDKNRQAKPRRSASPQSRSPTHEALPTRPRPDAKRPATNMSFNVGSRASRSPPPQSRTEGDKESNRSEDGQASGGEEDPMDAEDDDIAAMQAMMGFGGFGTTKNKKVSGNNAGGVRKEKKTEYRQYLINARHNKVSDFRCSNMILALLSRSSVLIIFHEVYHAPHSITTLLRLSPSYQTFPELLQTHFKLLQEILSFIGHQPDLVMNVGAMFVACLQSNFNLDSFQASYLALILYVSAIHLILIALRNWICRPPPPNPEEVVSQLRADNLVQLPQHGSAQVTSLPAQENHSHVGPDRLHVLFSFAMIWSIGTLFLTKAASLVYPDFYQAHIEFFTIAWLLALAYGHIAVLIQTFIDWATLAHDITLGLICHVIDILCRSGNLVFPNGEDMEEGLSSDEEEGDDEDDEEEEEVLSEKDEELFSEEAEEVDEKISSENDDEDLSEEFQEDVF